MVLTTTPEQKPFLWAACSGLLTYGLIFAVMLFHPVFKEPMWRLTLALAHFPVAIFLILKYPATVAKVRDGLVTLHKKTLFFYMLAMCLSVYMCGTHFLRSVMFFFYGLPAFIILWPYALAKIKAIPMLGKVAYVFLMFTLFQTIAPGLYIPPFLDGIAGWSKRVSAKTTIQMRGLKLVRNDGAEIWLSNAFSNPATFILWTIEATRHTTGDALFGYYFEIYKKNWDLVQQRMTPNQRYLGKYAYPGHNPYVNLDYTGFPPESIDKVIFVAEKYHPETLQLLEKKIEGTYELDDDDRKPHPAE